MFHNFFKRNKKEEKLEDKSEEFKQEPTSEIEQSIQGKKLENDKTFSFFDFKKAVSKTTESLVENVVKSTQDKEIIDDDMLDDIEEKLIRADLGVNVTVEIVEKLRNKMNTVKPSEIKDFLKDEFFEIIKSNENVSLNIKEGQLNIILITGVNGSGKTTLIGKLAHRFTSSGKNVIVAAADTFRAAAEEQLDIWSKRAGAHIVRRNGADPASVVYDAIQEAKNQNTEILLIDTAGRLQNKFNLMQELEKIKKVIDKEASNNLVESILVVDATTGQNGLSQAKVFKEVVQLTSVALTKLDGTAKGGIVLSIAKEFELPVKLIGVGEKMTDLKDFNSDDFLKALFE